MNYVGVDHHRRHSPMTMMDQEGQVLRTGLVPNLQSEIEKFLLKSTLNDIASSYSSQKRNKF